ncbi:ABC transporter substrate-binding protein [Arthrobacter sp. I2-34]|uniref:ABC transporter substrate-binding protein n=1 Tax=Arthrobacter hankyongi TaxID=2904801 RepID=A0ABS9L8T2_9MICC|nr:ABC transporter substrate-binding protein [Arthrobacter hankyongi]MCG2623045.1 ABC transporter substrate-binding protein [Arthrobacter hankyongi]
MTKTRNLLTAGLLGAGLLALTACGGTAASTSNSADAGETRKINVTVAPVVDTSPVYLAQQQGLFKKKNLEVTISVAPTAGARIPALVSGAAQFGLVGSADVLQAASAGIPLRAVGTTSVTTKDPARDTGKVFVAADSDVKDPADLNGRAVAVGGLGGGGELSLRAALDEAGADSSKVKFLEVPFDSMLNSLETGQVDAISTVAPFTDAAKASGAREIMSPGALAVPGATQQILVTTQDYLGKDPEAAKDFVDAMAEATEYAAENPQAVRKILPTFSKTPQKVADTMQLPVFDPDLTVERVRIWSDLMLRYGFVKKEVNVDELVAEVR